MHYIIRIELHSATATKYADLAQKLAAAGITDTIRGDDGVLYKLPPAEYHSQSAADTNTIRTTCAGIAATIVPSYAVLVTQGNSAWIGLQAVR